MLLYGRGARCINVWIGHDGGGLKLEKEGGKLLLLDCMNLALPPLQGAFYPLNRIDLSVEEWERHEQGRGRER